MGLEESPGNKSTMFLNGKLSVTVGTIVTENNRPRFYGGKGEKVG